MNRLKQLKVYVMSLSVLILFVTSFVLPVHREEDDKGYEVFVEFLLTPMYQCVIWPTIIMPNVGMVLATTLFVRGKSRTELACSILVFLAEAGIGCVDWSGMTLGPGYLAWVGSGFLLMVGSAYDAFVIDDVERMGDASGFLESVPRAAGAPDLRPPGHPGSD
jgi:hypothetical protein